MGMGMKSRFWRRYSAIAAGLFTLLAFTLAEAPARAGQLVVDIGASRTLDTAALLARPDVKTIDVPMDASYGRAMSYRAVPLRALVDAAALPPGKMVQFVAADGFVSTLSASLLFPSGADRAEAWLAIEPPDAPWPNTPGGAAPGPFYLVWLHPEASGVLQEQWPYNVAKILPVEAPATRWPQIVVGEDAPADSPARKGQALVASQCMVCHRIDGAGDADIAPDLVRPYSPTEYVQPWALRALIRDPGSVRNWPDRRMPAFSKEVLSDADLDAIAAYLAYLAGKRK
jgi:mono/diheme cytochrome c family protein